MAARKHLPSNSGSNDKVSGLLKLLYKARIENKVTPHNQRQGTKPNFCQSNHNADLQAYYTHLSLSNKNKHRHWGLTKHVKITNDRDD